MKLVPIRQDQVKKLILREAQANLYPWTEKMLSDSINATATGIQIIHKHDVVGYCLLQSVIDEAELLNIVIFKSFQQQGLGAMALLQIKNELRQNGVKKILLEVRESNVAAQALYVKLGFLKVRLRQNYYRAGKHTEDAIMMQCEL